MPAVAQRETSASSGGNRNNRSNSNRETGQGNAATAADAGLSGLTGTPALKVGSRGNQVKALQRALNSSGAHLSVDGIFGSATKSAVMSFQRARGLSVDGIVGPKTAAALNRGGGGGGGSNGGNNGNRAGDNQITGSPMLKRGDRGEKVKELQRLLNRHGCRCDIDGIFGLGTHRAVRCFQRENGLVGDGVVGPRTAAALYKAPAGGHDGNNNSNAGQGNGNNAGFSGTPPLKIGSAGSRVRQLQKLLNDHNADLIVDGEFGAVTANAVRRFQAVNGLTADGMVGPATARKLTSGSAKDIPATGGGGGDFTGGENEKEIRNAVISAAESHLGAPYYWGADGPSMFDCSGFVLYVLREETGLINWGDDTAHGIRNRLPRVNAPQRGDPVFYSSGGSVSHIEFATGKGSETIGASGGGSSTRGNDPNARVKYGNWNRDGRTKTFGSISGLIRNKTKRR